jgi:hypothetical protein
MPSFSSSICVGVSRPGGSLGRRVRMSPRAPAQMGQHEAEREGGERRRERGGNPAAFVFVPRPGRVRLQ